MQAFERSGEDCHLGLDEIERIAFVGGWTFDVAAGEAAHELIEAATTRAASLIVVGGRSHSLLGGLVLGSVAQKLVRSSPISVLVVRHADVNDYQLA